jgi:hypothetical protein
MMVGDLLEEAIPRVATGGLKPITFSSRHVTNVGRSQGEGQLELLGQCADKLGILLGVVAKLVVKVSDDDLPRPIRFESQEDPQKRHAVGPARDANNHRSVVPIKRLPLVDN